MALLIGVPALAQPLCAAGCGGEELSSCCCARKGIPNDGAPSYTAPSCCGTDSPRADLRDLDGAVSGGPGPQAAAGNAQQVAAAVIVAAAALAPVDPVASFADSGGTAATGPPIFISVSSLRL